MRTSLTIWILLFSFNAFSQEWLWAHTVSSNQVYTYGARVDARDFGYFAGSTSGDAIFESLHDTIPVSDLKGFTVKFDTSGNLIWVSGLWHEGSISSIPWHGGFALDKSGNSYLTGAYEGTTFFGNVADTIQRTSYQNSADEFLGKLDSNGNPLYFSTHADICSDYGYIISVLNNGELIYLRSDIIDCGPMFGTAVDFMSKLDSVSGNPVWTLTPNANIPENNDVRVIPTSDGDFLICGYYNDATTFQGISSQINVPASSGQTDVFLVKYSTNGEVLWARTVLGLDSEHIRGIAVDGNNNILLAIESQGICLYDSMALPTLGSRTMHIIKVDSIGNYIDHISFNAGYYMHFWLSDLKSDKGGNVYITASLDTTLIINSDTVFNNSDPLNKSMFILKFDSHLNYLWSQYVTGHCNCNSFIAITDSLIYYTQNYDGDVSLHGSSFSFPASNSPQYSPLFAAIKNGGSTRSIQQSLSTAKESKVNNILVYPNPSSSIFTATYGNSQELKNIRVYNLLGACVFKNTTNQKNSNIDMTMHPPGIYLLEIIAPSGKGVAKICLQ